MVVQAEATSTNANTGGNVEIRSLEAKKRAVLSDRIWSSLSIDDGSSEQKCRMMEGRKYREILCKQSVLRA